MIAPTGGWGALSTAGRAATSLPQASRLATLRPSTAHPTFSTPPDRPPSPSPQVSRSALFPLSTARPAFSPLEVVRRPQFSILTDTPVIPNLAAFSAPSDPDFGVKAVLSGLQAPMSGGPSSTMIALSRRPLLSGEKRKEVQVVSSNHACIVLLAGLRNHYRRRNT